VTAVLTELRAADAASRGPRSISETSRRAPTIGVIYPSGWGNLGDEAILQATFATLRAQWPNARLHAFTLNPQRTRANHAVTADYLTGISRPMFLSARDDGPFAVRVARGLARRVRRVPIASSVMRTLAELTASTVFETMSLRTAWSFLKEADLLLAAGGGQLDAAWGGAMGQPYALARWAWLARRAGVPFAFLSVGYGSARGKLSRWLLRYAIGQTTYCSVRDAGSRSLTTQLGISKDLPIIPDLAFGLKPAPPLPRNRPGYDVAISPMVYLRPGNWPTADASAYERFVDLWAAIVVDRVGRGDRVHLFVTDPADMKAVLDVCAKLDARTRDYCSINEHRTPDALLTFFRQMDVVVSSRLHGVLLAINTGRPVLAISHERKVRAVMGDVGLTAYCTDLPTVSAEQACATLRELTKNLASCERRLAEYVSWARAAIRQQDEMLPHLMRRR